MAIKACFGWVAVGLTIVGVSGIFLSGIVGLVWGPLCMLGDPQLQKDMNCKQIVRSKPISVALIVCGFMVLALTITIIAIETRIQIAQRVTANNLLNINKADNYQYIAEYEDIEKVAPPPNKLLTSNTDNASFRKTPIIHTEAIQFSANQNAPNPTNLYSQENETLLSVHVDQNDVRTKIHFVQTEEQKEQRKSAAPRVKIAEQFRKGNKQSFDDSACSTPNSAHFRYADDSG